MRSKTIIVVIVSVLWVCLMASCASQKQRDLKKFTKIVERNPDFIETDTIEKIVEVPVDTASFDLETDTTAFREKLERYIVLNDSLKNLIAVNERDHETNLRAQLLAEKRRDAFMKLFSGTFTKMQFPIVSKDGIVTYMVEFDPYQRQMKWWGSHKKFNTIVPQRVKEFVYKDVTNWQAFKKIWLIPAILLLVIALLVIFK